MAEVVVGQVYNILLPSEHAPPTTTKSKELATKIEILGIRPASSSSTRKTQYFVHYINTDKRLDKWIGGQWTVHFGVLGTMIPVLKTRDDD